MTTTIRRPDNSQESFVQATTFDGNYGRVKFTTEPGGVKTYHHYNSRGYLREQGDLYRYFGANNVGNVWYNRINQVDAFGNVTRSELAKGDLLRAERRDRFTGALLEACAQTLSLGLPDCDWADNITGSGVWNAAKPAPDLRRILDLAYSYDVFGNVLEMRDYGRMPGSSTNLDETQLNAIRAETYSYDKLHRLTATASKAILAGSTSQVWSQGMSFDALGNLTQKNETNGQNGLSSSFPYTYTAGSSRLDYINRNSSSINQIKYLYDANGNVIKRSGAGLGGISAGNYLGAAVNIGYDVDNLAQAILQEGSNDGEKFRYAPGGGLRYWSWYSKPTGITEILTLGSYEKEYAPSGTTERWYLPGGAVKVRRITSSGSTDTIGYQMGDRLGSASVDTDEAGNLLGKRGFDAFGLPRDQYLMKGYGYSEFESSLGRKGFTGHEHLDKSATPQYLIHMNGRIYDPWIGRFYGVDPFIQFPSNSQSLNPYSYLMNNPFAGKDPTGYCIENAGSKIKDCDRERSDQAAPPPSPKANGNGGKESQSSTGKAREDGTTSKQLWEKAKQVVNFINGSKAEDENAKCSPHGCSDQEKGRIDKDDESRKKINNLLAAVGITFEELVVLYRSKLLAKAFDEIDIPTNRILNDGADELVEQVGMRGQSEEVRNSEVSINPNQLNHIFSNSSHKLDPLLEAFGGSQEKAFQAVQSAANTAFKEGRLTVGPNGILPGGQAGGVLNIKGVNVQLVGGKIINGEVRIGSVSRRFLDE